MADAQRMSYWPAWPLPVAGQALVEAPEHDCSYLPRRAARFRAFESRGLTAAGYQAYLDAGFRRSGRLIYQPICAGCRACVPLRVEVARLAMTKSLRRVWRRNGDVRVRVAQPAISAEKWQLYERYLRDWHGRTETADGEGLIGFVQFLYDSPVETLEFEYRDGAGKLLGVGICDAWEKSISSVYFYFDPAEARRSLGTFSALYEMNWAKELKIPYWYAGYWVKGCAAMEYKARFRPCEVLATDGVWREMGATGSET